MIGTDITIAIVQILRIGSGCHGELQKIYVQESEIKISEEQCLLCPVASTTPKLPE